MEKYDSDQSSQDSSSSKLNNEGFKEIEVIEINRTNFQECLPYLLVCIKSADFIALDLELSGLGGKGLKSKNVSERYSAIREAARTRSVLSLGISVMKLINKNEKKRKLKYQTQVFNILTLSSKPFTIEPNALKFLARHSFDFNRLIQFGVEFQGKECPLKNLFHTIFETSATICVHNGFIDLAFIYEQFYGISLPETLDEFCNNLSDLFPVDYLPIVDSKYLSEYQTRMPSSFLEYVFRRSQGDNEIERQNRRIYIDIIFQNTDNMMTSVKDAIEKVECKLPEGFPYHPLPINLHNYVCLNFANHGFCNANTIGKCPKLHDVDSAIDIQRCKENKKAFKRKRRYDNVISDSVAQENAEQEISWKKRKFDPTLKVDHMKETLRKRIAVSGLHRAGVDAFMTVFSVIYQQRLELMKNDKVDVEYVNKLPLSGKEQPILIRYRTLLKEKSEKDEHSKQIEIINKERKRMKQE